MKSYVFFTSFGGEILRVGQAEKKKEPLKRKYSCAREKKRSSWNREQHTEPKEAVMSMRIVN